MTTSFITFEGGEGAGKTTMIDRTRAWLASRGHDVVTTREPGGTEVAEKIREIVLGHDEESLSSTAELLLVFAARAQHLDTLIRPAIADGKTVLCDRFTDATWAYQGAGRGLDHGFIARLEEGVHGDLQPDLTVLLDIPVEVGMTRVRKRGKADRMESEAMRFYQRVRENYLARAQEHSHRFAVVDASVSEIRVWNAVETILESRIGGETDQE